MLGDLLELLQNLPFIIGGIFALGLCIFVHELGHYLAARWRGLKVTRFSVGMGPKMFGWTKDGVDYRISWLPIGGYVALPQLADMGRLEGGKEGENEDPLPSISFTDKVIVSVAGAVFNFLLAIALAVTLWVIGQPVADQNATNVVGYVNENFEVALDSVSEPEVIAGPAYQAGIRPGDVITHIDGNPVKNFIKIQESIITGVDRNADGQPQTEITVLREGQSQSFMVFPELIPVNRTNDRMRMIGISAAYDLVIERVEANSPAEAAGLQPGDRLVSADGTPLLDLRTFIDIVSAPDLQSTMLTLERDEQMRDIALTPVNVALTKPVLQARFTRSGQESVIQIRPDYAEGYEGSKTDPTISSSLVIHQIVDDSADALSNLRPEDRIIAVAGKAVESLEDLQEKLDTLAGPVAQITVGRNGRTLEAAVVFSLVSTEQIEPLTRQLVGFEIRNSTSIAHIDPFTQIADQIGITLRILRALFHTGSNISVGHLAGPVGMVDLLSRATQTDFRFLFAILILINVNLGILNLLPIPVLDGGHIMFATIAKLRKKPLPINLMANLQGAFMILLMGMIFFVLFKDSTRIIDNSQVQSERELQEKLRIRPQFIEPDSTQP